MLGVRLALLSTAALVCLAQLESFLPPVNGIYAANADLVPAITVSTASDCASACLSFSGAQCVSFNLCNNAGGSLACGISGWNVSYVAANASQCSWYRRSIPRNDTSIIQAVPWLLSVPTSGVSTTAGPLHDTFWTHLNQYLKVRDPLDMLFFFAKRAGVQNPAGYCFGWDEWIKGSATGNYLMGTGGALRWVNDSDLWAGAQAVVNGIAAYRDPVDGWVWAFNESDIQADNLPDYCASWVTRGLLDAHGAGISGAIELARASVSQFNNHSLLPFFMPPNGGPNPVQPFPSGFNNDTFGGYGQPYGHMIYIQYQGMIKHTLMALSEAGTQADVDLVKDHLQEDWWLSALLARDTYHGVWHRQFFSHNYEVTAYEAFLDMYVLTGNTTYLQAMLNAWDLLRQGWIHVGGSMAINEGYYYPPQSYYIGFTGTNVASKHGHQEHVHGAHGHAHGHGHGQEVAVTAGNSTDPYYHAPCMPAPGVQEEQEEPYVSPLVRLKQDAMAAGGPNDKDPPTGELCGSVFWTKFNQRFHRLYPDNETFTGEMERAILNVGVAALGQVGSGGQGPNGTGIRYFANQHKQKQYPSMHASCCEGQGTRLFGSLPEYIYTLMPLSVARALGLPVQTGLSQAQEAGAVGALYVDLYAGSNITFDIGGQQATLTQSTAWPYGTSITLTLSLPSAWSGTLSLRMPQWVAAPSVPVMVNGQPWAQQGVPGSYLKLSQSWPAGTSSITYSLPMAFTAHYYSGLSQLPPYARWAYTYGPVLLAGEGPWNATVDALVMPQGVPLDPSRPASWMQPSSDGNSLHWSVSGAPSYSFKPYFEVQQAGEMFSVYPCFWN